MDANRKTATLVGVLYITGTVAGILSVAFTGSLLENPEYLTEISRNDKQIIAGALMVLTMGLALAMIPVVMFPILKKAHETLALGYLVFRGALETVTYIAMVIVWLFLLALSQEYVKTGTPDAAHLDTLGASLLQVSHWLSEILSIIFTLGALMFYYALYQSSLIPRWLSGWGFITAIPYFASGVLAMFDVIEPLSTTEAIFRVPLGLQEMVMAIWLIVKGFNSATSTFRTANANTPQVQISTSS